MANHPKFKEWQGKVALLKAKNATDAAPADAKKEAADRIKLLEAAITKLNGCYPDIYKTIWGQLEEQVGATKVVLENLIERFEELDGASIYAEAIEAVDTAILNKENEVKEASERVGEAEKRREELKNQLAALEPELKKVETLCDDMGKWGVDMAKARKEAEGIPPDQRPIEALTAIKTLWTACETLEKCLNADPIPIDDKVNTLDKQIAMLEELLRTYRANGKALEDRRNQLNIAKAELAEMKLSRLESVLLKFEELSNAPQEPINKGGGGGDDTDPEGQQGLDAGDKEPEPEGHLYVRGEEDFFSHTP